MNAFGFLFTFVMSALLVRLPRNLAPLPILMGASYITLSQQLEIGSLHFPVGRILIAVGIFRVMSKEEHIAGGSELVGSDDDFFGDLVDLQPGFPQANRSGFPPRDSLRRSRHLLPVSRLHPETGRRADGFQNGLPDSLASGRDDAGREIQRNQSANVRLVLARRR